MEVFQILPLIFFGILGTTHAYFLDAIPIDLGNYNNFFAAYQRELSDLSNLTVPGLIQSEGYPIEVHTVTTTDGYILTMHRIPHGKFGQRTGKVVMIQHGILCSSADWVISGSGRALAFILADAGYDVWLGNARGNTQSRRHIRLDPDIDSAFWEFSFHEIGVIDIPQMIDYVLLTTRLPALYYIGHSQGSTAYFAMLSSLPMYNSKIIASVSLSPVVFMEHMTSPLLRILAIGDKGFTFLSNLVGVHEFLPKNSFMDLLADTICQTNSIAQILCSNSLFAITGFSPSQMNTTLLPRIMRFSPAGASVRQLMHYAQLITSGAFRQFDFGFFKNMAKYHSTDPPEYQLSMVTTPSYLINSRNDWLSAEEDVQRLCTMIRGCHSVNLVDHSTFNHVDYMYGIDAPRLVYDKIVNTLGLH